MSWSVTNEQHVLRLVQLKTWLKIQGVVAISSVELHEKIHHLLFTKIQWYKVSFLYILPYILSAIKCLQSIKHCAHFSCLTSAFSFIFLLSKPLFTEDKFADIQHNYLFFLSVTQFCPKFLCIKNQLCLVYPS